VNGVFLDSAGLIALWNRRDQWHEAAAASFIALSPAAALVTTSYIVAECGNTFSRSEIRELLGDLGDQLAMEDTLIFPNDADWSQAWRAFRSGHPGSPSLVDEISFAVMRRLRLRRAFTNDGHFRTAGFETLF